MPIQVVTNYHAETMVTEVFVYQHDPESLTRQVLSSDGVWQEAGAPGMAAPPTYRIPDNVLPLVVNSLGVPMSDAHLLDALRHERGRVDRMVDTLAEAVTRGL
jgi:hypothetical protein